jgi:ubiquinone/menaquinone biosynthesis C-methylase UbiE
VCLSLVNNNTCLFNRIAPAYGLYYKSQKKRYLKVLDDVKNELDITRYQKIIDVGCGTGALCSVLYQKGLSVTGVDTAQKMLKIARNNSKNTNINFIEANVLERLPFEDKYFDISIASYVAHGLKEHQRKRMYAEMTRIAKHRVIIYDYNGNRSLLTTIAEWMERGDYFNFIKNAEFEMNNCVVEKKKCFSEVKVINVDVQAAWYICTPA